MASTEEYFRTVAEYMRELALKHKIEFITVKAPPIKFNKKYYETNQRVIIVDYIGMINK